MAAIYSLANFTIIVTDGDSDSGIAGISHGKRQAPIRDQISGFVFTTQPASWQEIAESASIWSTRGWTYQEAVLSPRQLYLTEAQAIFQCSTFITTEDGMTKEIESFPEAYKLPSSRLSSWEPVCINFYRHISRYRKRSLTNLSDVYNAIAGVATALYGAPNPLWKGLPRQEFDESLLWALWQ